MWATDFADRMGDAWIQLRQTLRDRKTMGLRLLFVLGFAFFGYRFINVNLASFINDEPVFLQYSRDMYSLGRVATFSPLVGTQGVHYGPTAIWLHGIIHALFGATVEAHIVAMVVLFTASNAAVAFAIGRLYGDRYVIPATLGIWVASSPYQFFWSRTAWDPLVNVCMGGIIALLCTPRRLLLWRVLAIGALVGLGISTHPAITPLAGVALVMTFIRSPIGRRIGHALAAGLVAFVVNLPYLSYTLTAVRPPLPAREPFSLRRLSLFFPEALRVSTLGKIDYYFDNDWLAFRKFSSLFSGWSEASGHALTWGSVVFALGLLVTVMLYRRGTQQVIVLGAIAVWAGYLVFYTYLGLAPHPHYQFSIWWVMLVPIAGILGWLRPYRVIYVGLVSAIWCVALSQCAFVVRWMDFIRERRGTVGIHYDVPIGEQRRIVREICARPAQGLYVINQTSVFVHSLAYVTTTEPTCNGKRVAFFGGPPMLATGEKRLILRYAGPNTAKVDVVPIP